MSQTAPPATVLVVDDDKGLARLIEKAVRRDGFEAVLATSGQEALDWLKNNRADLMLLDLKLTDIQGAELVERLAARGCTLPFVIITGQGDERVAVDMMKRGALDYLVKDVQFLEFVPTVVRRSLTQLERDRRLAMAEREQKKLEREILEISEREQRRIGHDLHDGLGQTLAGIDVLLEVLKKRLVTSSPGDADAVSAISGYVKEAIQQARMLAHGLSPVEVETSGLMSALKSLCENTSRLFKVSCNFHCDSPVLVGDHARATHVYRIAQEAINNAIKHGKARHVDVLLNEEGDEVVLQVNDDGTPPAEGTPRKTDGMGLHTMRYRAGIIGGRVEFRPFKPNGTTVMCTFPRS